MAKYSYEFKKKVVMEYLNGGGGTDYLAKTYGVVSSTDIRKWIKYYNVFDDAGLRRSRKQEKYSFEKKLAMVELYLSNEVSYQELALQEGITNPSIIANWVRRFRVAGPDALRPHKKGRKKSLDKPKQDTKIHLQEEKMIDTSAEYIKKLEDELLKLRIENAFLKELRRLRLEDEAKMREWHSSSTASAENLN